MKKCVLLFVILVAVLTLTLVAFSCESDRVGQTAEAFTYYSYFINDGVVKENMLPSYYMDDIQLSGYNPVNSTVLQFNDGIYSYGFLPSVDTVNHSIAYSSPNTVDSRFFVIYSVEQSGYYFLHISYHQSSSSSLKIAFYTSLSSQMVYGRNVSLNDYIVSSCTTNSDISSCYLYAHTKVCFILQASSISSFTMYNIKLEYYPTYTASSDYNGFTGFALPDISYHPEQPAPNPYDSWDGLVHPNYINSPDFYNYPVFVESYNNLADTYKNMWLSNMEGYIYDYNGPDTLSSLRMNVHAYGQNEDDAFLYYYDNYADSFDFAGINAHFRLALNSEVAGTVTLTSGGGSVSERFDVGGSLVDLLLPDTYTTSFIAISIVFDFYLGPQDKICTLYYSKLEWGTFFTGYVVPDHPFSSAVQDNVLNNYDFSSVPLPSDSPRQGAWWYLYAEEQGVPGEHDESISFSSEYGGLTFDATPQNSNGTIYFTYAVPESDSFDSSGSYIFTVQLWARDTFGSPVVFTAKDGVNDVTYRSIFPAAGGPMLYSFRFPKINGVILSLSFPVNHGVPNTLYYAKLESFSFTGFCGNYQEFYDNGYNSGYADGYTTGSESYGTSLFTLNFVQPADYTVLVFGWSDMGFLDADAMFSSSMTFDFVGFYRALGYAIATQVTVDVPAQSIRRLYASADINFNVSNVSIAQDYVLLELSENSSRLVIVNAQYPNDYTPEVYPEYRVVRVNVQRGLSNILDAYGDSKYEQGRLVGYDQGYMQGEADGERRGYSQATEVAMNSTGGWFGFVSAFIDVPIKALTSLLDFDFFGFNLLNIIKILLVFSLVYLVIRLITKGMIAQ